MAFGLSFVPGQQADQTRKPGAPGAGAAVSPIQQAIQMLSLRLPRVTGAQGLAPGPLLNAPGGGGFGGGGGIDALLRLLFGMGGPMNPAGVPIQTQPSGMPGQQRYTVPPRLAPLPRVSAGIRTTDPRAEEYRTQQASQYRNSLPTPPSTPIPGRPMGYGNTPDHWRPWGASGPAGWSDDPWFGGSR